MKKILISNIGNRNLLYKGDYIPRHTFREKTKRLIDNFAQEKDQLQLNIMDVLLDQKKEEIEKVILFASDQEGEYRHQDTLHEAEILARKIDETYGLPTHITKLKCSVVDNNELLRNFRNILKSIIRNYPDAEFILCDSGGTAQQKSSLKIMTEYLLPPSRFRFYHITEQKDGPSMITEVNQWEYRRVIDAEQMSRLIEEGNYQGALSIHRLNSSEKGRDRKIDKLLQFAASRKAHLRKEARKYADPKDWQAHDLHQFSFLNEYDRGEPAGKNYPDFAGYIEEDDFFYLCELLSIAEYCYELKDHNNAMLYYQIFVESYLYSVLKPLGYDLTRNNYETVMNEIAAEIGKDTALSAEFVNRRLKPDRKGIPTLGLVCKSWVNDPTHQKMMQSIFKINGKLKKNIKLKETEIPGLDGLRNSYAHKGNGISPEKIKAAIPGWEEIRQEWHQLLGMPEKNIFVQMNEAIIEYMK